MLSVKQVYETDDGKTFSSRDEALKHEKKIFQRWLDTKPKIDIAALIQVSDTSPDEWRCSEQQIVEYVAQLAFTHYMENRPDVQAEAG